MAQTAKKILLSVLILGSLTYSFADRGLRKKSKNRVILNVTNTPTFQSSLAYNLKTGLKFKGFLLTDNFTNTPSSISSYQKGNTIYLLPNKQKIFVPELKQGYTGMKLIIKSKD